MDTYLPYVSESGQNGFRLLTMVLQNHPVLAKGIRVSFDFYNPEDKGKDIIKQKPFSTVIIGANGIGKSFILSVIAQVFRHIRALQNAAQVHPNSLGFKFAVSYFLNGHIYCVSNLPEGWTVQGNGSKGAYDYYKCSEDGISCGIHRCPLPVAILASSSSVSDKFSSTKNNDGYYHYLGIRNESSPNSTGTKTLVRKTVRGIAECLSQKEDFRQDICCLLKALDLEPRLKIEYSMRYKEVFLSSNLSVSYLEDVFDNWQEYFGNSRNSAPWGHSKFPEIRTNEANLNLIVEYLQRVRQKYGGNRRFRITYSLDDNSLPEDWQAIQFLSELGILNYPSLRVYKKTRGASDSYDYEESSSGETNMICMFIGILSRIEHHSLVLIDEPELSAHPNWQIRFIEWLNTILGRYWTSHFIIATHSHFLLTDLEPGYSSIMALKKENGYLKDVGRGVNTFCWSVDDILYEVFEVRNTRNEAFEMDVVKAFSFVESPDTMNRDEAIALFERLQKVKLGAGDPLVDLLNNMRKYVEFE